MPESYVSQREIARKAGVSVSAVSLALRNHPKISAKQREEIQRIAREMGYRSDPMVVQLMEHLRKARPKRQTSTLAVLIPEIRKNQLSGLFINEVIEGAREQAKEAGFGLDLFFLEDQGVSPKRLRTILLTRGIKGLMIAPFASGPGALQFDFSGFSAATAGYSLVDPLLHRSCPNYLQMLDEILEAVLARGYRRIGLVLHYKEGGIGHKLFSSSYLFYQAHIPSDQRIPILPKGQISEEKLAAWVSAYRPEVIIGPGFIFSMLEKINLKVPEDLGFASLDICDPPKEVAGANHRYRLVGSETIKLLLSQIHLNLSGLPESPKVVLVDSHFRPGFSLPDNFRPADGSKRRSRPHFRVDGPLKAETDLVPDGA
jgi:LacI family transcriptional regulator